MKRIPSAQYIKEYKPTISDVKITEWKLRTKISYFVLYESYLYWLNYNGVMYAVLTDSEYFGVDECGRVCGWAIDTEEGYYSFLNTLTKASHNEKKGSIFWKTYYAKHSTEKLLDIKQFV